MNIAKNNQKKMRQSHEKVQVKTPIQTTAIQNVQILSKIICHFPLWRILLIWTNGGLEGMTTTSPATPSHTSVQKLSPYGSRSNTSKITFLLIFGAWSSITPTYTYDRKIQIQGCHTRMSSSKPFLEWLSICLYSQSNLSDVIGPCEAELVSWLIK